MMSPETLQEAIDNYDEWEGKHDILQEEYVELMCEKDKYEEEAADNEVNAENWEHRFEKLKEYMEKSFSEQWWGDELNTKAIKEIEECEL